MPMFGSQMWREAATLVREVPCNGLPRELVHEGPLWEVLVYVDRLDEDEQRPLTIALPDRRSPPLRFGHAEIVSLLGRHDRPGFGNPRRMS